MTMHGLRHLAIAGAVLVGALGGAAIAGDGSVRPNYVFPDGTVGFDLDSAGLIKPCFLVGFGPLGPGDSLSLDITDPLNPVVTDTHSGGTFELLFSIDDHVTNGVIATPPAPDSDGVTSFRTLLDGHLIGVNIQTGPGQVDPTSWVAFSPTSGPPGDWFAVNFQYASPMDAFVKFNATVDGASVAFSAAPEPGTWTLTILGLGLAGGAMRRRARSTAV